jgi:hypothetical protein
MKNLAVWRIDESGTPPGGQAPLLTPVERSHLGLEKHLEAWIAADAKLIGGELTIVGQQVRIDDGILDLLAIDARDRWVVIELTARHLDSGTRHQALYYASSLARLTADELCAKLKPGLEGARRRRDAVGAGETASRLRGGRWGARDRGRARRRRCHRRPRAHARPSWGASRCRSTSSASRCSSWLADPGC